MLHEIVERVGITDQHRLDVWFDQAMNDQTVMPYLGDGSSRPRLIVPDDDQDGVVLMNKANTGVLKLYFDPDIRTARFGIWTLQEAPTRSLLAHRLISTAMVVLGYHPDLVWLTARVKTSNIHGMAFATRYLDEPWGVEPKAGFDHGWVDVAHFRETITNVRQNASAESINRLLK